MKNNIQTSFVFLGLMVAIRYTQERDFLNLNVKLLEEFKK
jgi:hypothetical protein